MTLRSNIKGFDTWGPYGRNLYSIADTDEWGADMWADTMPMSSPEYSTTCAVNSLHSALMAEHERSIGSIHGMALERAA